MAEVEIPETARQFFLYGIDSIAQWEGLLLLRAAPDRAQDIASLARSLYISDHDTSVSLHALVERGILEKLDTVPPAFRYSPSSPELDEVIANCAELYRKYLIPVTRIIHSKPKHRIKAFAEAFRFRKD